MNATIRPPRLRWIEGQIILQGKSRLDWRDSLATAALFAATAAVVLWQNAHVAVLWDLSYVLDSAARIAIGQVPYRDFPFAHAPLTFLIQAAIIRLTGRVFFHHVLYAAIVGGLGTVLTWRIVLRVISGRVASVRLVAFLLAAPLAVLGVYCILPLPSYDCDCAVAILVAIWLLQRLAPGSVESSRIRVVSRGLIAGAALCLPLFFKQNIGLPFLLVSGAAILLVFTMASVGQFGTAKRELWTPVLIAVLAGAAATLLAAVLLIHFTAGLGNYIHWTIQFAAQRRLPGLQQMLGVYNDLQLVWTLPCIFAGALVLHSRSREKRWPRVLALFLLSAPFLYTLGSLLINDDADERGDSLLALWPMLLIAAAVLALWNLRREPSLKPFVPILLLVAIHGTLMSQQLWGSTYAIWPLLIVLIAEMIAFLPGNVAPIVTAVVSATLLVCGGFYTASEERLSYAQLPHEPVQHSAFPQLKGMSIAGPYLPDFDELLRFAADHIPQSDTVILLPGEAPFYFVSGRVPQFPVLLFDPATDPYSPDQLVDEARRRQIRWLIVKRDLQLTADPTPQRDAVIGALLQDFKPAAKLRAYDIYRRP